MPKRSGPLLRLDLIPLGIEFIETALTHRLALCSNAPLHGAEASLELEIGGAQRMLRIDAAVTREIDDREQQIPDLTLQCLAVATPQFILHFTQLFLHLGQHTLYFTPVETTP